ncbi:glycosyltransferase family 4 protein [Brachybacterium sp. EF45031]|uniref:glycosyltransferase family 4 protein n=1 Tax=Brachybacterium sillae TaxID=2810536 RepID=UPI00217D606D|nr:glycosyltransferase family 4 protein [Brachybacterium sillae]MCS6711627.1 glycosyltransferase family 4 protein [Brachybacterium sillae]
MPSARVAIATNNGDIGGGEVMLLNIAEALRSLGIEVLVLGPTGPGDLVSEARDRGFAVEALPAEGRRAWMVALLRWRLRHRDLPLWCNGLVPSLATAGIGPRLVHLHIVPEGLQRPAARIAQFGARRTVVISEFMRGRLGGGTVLHNWTEEISFRPRPLPERGPVRIGFLGRLTRDKGVHVLAEAVDRLRREHGLDVRLVLAGANRFGDAEDDRVISAALAPLGDAVERLGWVDRTEFFAGIDVAVFPSVWEEPFGLVAAEAMAAGIPFVISRSGALPEVTGSEHPWVVRPGDSADLARALFRLLRESGPDSLGPELKRARRRWEREFSPSAGRQRVALLLADLPRSAGALSVTLASRFHGGVVSTGGMNGERCSWPGMIRGVETRTHPLEGAPFRCPTLPCSSTPARAWTSLRSPRSHTPARCC